MNTITPGYTKNLTDPEALGALGFALAIGAALATGVGWFGLASYLALAGAGAAAGQVAAGLASGNQAAVIGGLISLFLAGVGGALYGSLGDEAFRGANAKAAGVLGSLSWGATGEASSRSIGSSDGLSKGKC